VLCSACAAELHGDLAFALVNKGPAIMQQRYSIAIISLEALQKGRSPRFNPSFSVFKTQMLWRYCLACPGFALLCAGCDQLISGIAQSASRLLHIVTRRKIGARPGQSRQNAQSYFAIGR
jgi:hypothetical protein